MFLDDCWSRFAGQQKKQSDEGIRSLFHKTEEIRRSGGYYSGKHQKLKKFSLLVLETLERRDITGSNQLYRGMQKLIAERSEFNQPINDTSY